MVALALPVATAALFGGNQELQAWQQKRRGYGSKGSNSMMLVSTRTPTAQQQADSNLHQRMIAGWRAQLLCAL